MVVAVDVLLSHGLHVDGRVGPGPLCPLFCPRSVRHTVWWMWWVVVVVMVVAVDVLLSHGLHVDGRVGPGPLRPQFCPGSVGQCVVGGGNWG